MSYAIAGTSMGAVIGGAHMAGMSRSIYRDGCIEDLWRSFFCVSSSLTNVQPMVHGRGPLWHAVRASISLPGFLLPVWEEGEPLIDGSCLNNLPTDLARAIYRSGTVIAVSVNESEEMSGEIDTGPVLSGWVVLGRKLLRRRPKTTPPSVAAIIKRASSLSGVYNLGASVRLADHTIIPPVGDFGTLDFASCKEVIQTEYENTSRQIEQWQLRREQKSTPTTPRQEPLRPSRVHPRLRNWPGAASHVDDSRRKRAHLPYVHEPQIHPGESSRRSIAAPRALASRCTGYDTCRSQEELMSNSSSKLMQSLHTRRQLAARGAALGVSIPALAGLFTASELAALAQDGGSINLASYSSDPEPRARMEGVVEIFNGGDSGYTVEVNTTEHEAFKQAIRTYLASDNPPDVLTWFAGNRMRFFSNNDLLMPLDDLYAENGWEESYSEGILAVSKGNDGSYYFVPTSYYHWAVWYRPSMFEELGLEIPETWDQFLTLIDSLKEAGKVPVSIGTLAPWTAAGWFDYLNMRQNGPEFHIQLMDGEVAYNAPEVKDTFARWRELLDREAFLPQPEAYSWQDAVTPFAQGDAGLYLMGRFIVDQFPDDLEDDLDFFRFPVIDEGVQIGEDAPTDGFFAAAQAPNPEGATELLSFLGGAEAQTYLVEQGGSPAVHQDVSLDLYDDVTRRGVEMLQESDYIAQFYDRDTHPDMAERGMAAFIEFWNNPDDLDAILDRLDEERQRVFEAES